MKKIIFLSTCVMLVASISLGISTYTEQAKLHLRHIEALASGEASNTESPGQTESDKPEIYPCHSGGPGSSSCSVSVDGSIASGGLAVACEVTCTTGYYACCNSFKARCQCRNI